MSRRLALLANPRAAGGKALRVLAQAALELDRLGAGYRTVEAASVDQARAEAAAAARREETVVAIGGDGLVGALAGELRGTDSALAIVAAGRGNDFARVLGLPTGAAEAARLAVEGAERLFDVADVDGKPFVGIASLGFDSEANRIANEAKLVRGNLVYLYAALRALARWRHAGFTVTIDGERHDFRGYSVAVGNSKAYGGGMFLFPHAKLDDGRLEVLMVREHSKLRALLDLPKVFKGGHVRSPHVTFLSGEVVELAAEREFDIYADGDPVGRTPATVRIAKQSLRVIVPRS